MSATSGVADKQIKDTDSMVVADSALSSINREMEKLVELAAPSLVRVEAGSRGAGAGVVVHEQGLVVTNAHVARGRRLEVVDWQGRRIAARMHAWQGGRDLAALTMAESDLPALDIADSRSLRPGSWVLAMGHPFGVSGGATAGVVIGVGDRLPEVPKGGEDWLAMSLHLRPGHSGGPVVNAAGQLVGLNTRMAGLEVGLAIPSHVISRFLKEAFSVPDRKRIRAERGRSAHWL